MSKVRREGREQCVALELGRVRAPGVDGGARQQVSAAGSGVAFGFTARGRQTEARRDLFERLRERFPTPRTKCAREVEVRRLQMLKEQQEKLDRLYGKTPAEATTATAMVTEGPMATSKSK